MKLCTCSEGTRASSQSQDNNSPRAAVSRLLDVTHSLVRAGRFFATVKNEAHERFDVVLLSRVSHRVDGVVHLLSNATRDLRLIGVDKKAPFIELGGERISLQQASRRVRAIQTKLREKKVGDPVGDIIDSLTDGDQGDGDRPGHINPTG